MRPGRSPLPTLPLANAPREACRLLDIPKLSARPGVARCCSHRPAPPAPHPALGGASRGHTCVPSTDLRVSLLTLPPTHTRPHSGILGAHGLGGSSGEGLGISTPAACSEPRHAGPSPTSVPGSGRPGSASPAKCCWPLTAATDLGWESDPDYARKVPHNHGSNPGPASQLK